MYMEKNNGLNYKEKNNNKEKKILNHLFFLFELRNEYNENTSSKIFDGNKKKIKI